MKSPPWQEGQECPMAEGGCITAATTLRGCETEPNWAWQKQHKKFIAATVSKKQKRAHSAREEDEATLSLPWSCSHGRWNMSHKLASRVKIHLFPSTGVKELKKWTPEDLHAQCLLLASLAPPGPFFLPSSPLWCTQAFPAGSKIPRCQERATQLLCSVTPKTLLSFMAISHGFQKFES